MNHNNSNGNYTNITTTIVSDHNKNVTNESTRLFEEFVLILLPKLLSRNHKEERDNKNSHSFDSNIKDTSILFTLQMLLTYIDSSNKKKNINKGNNDASILTLQVLSKRTTPGELLPLIHNDANVDNNDGLLLLLSLISKRVDRNKKKESPTLLHHTEGLLQEERDDNLKTNCCHKINAPIPQHTVCIDYFTIDLFIINTNQKNRPKEEE